MPYATEKPTLSSNDHDLDSYRLLRLWSMYDRTF